MPLEISLAVWRDWCRYFYFLTRLFIHWNKNKIVKVVIIYSKLTRILEKLYLNLYDKTLGPERYIKTKENILLCIT